MPFKIVRNDLTKMQVDAIVNPINSKCTLNIDTMVYKVADKKRFLEESKKIGTMAEGDVAITSGFRLPAKYIIHVVYSCYDNGELEKDNTLCACYKKSLALAEQYGCKSIAFPLINTGGLVCSKEECMRIAVDEIKDFISEHDMLIYLVVLDMIDNGGALNAALKDYIDSHYVCEKDNTENLVWAETYGEGIENLKERHWKLDRKGCGCSRRSFPYLAILGGLSIHKKIKTVHKEDTEYHDFLYENESALDARINHMSDTFQEYLMYLINMKNLTNAEVYKKAIVTKQLFSKIKLNPNYHPDKVTAMRLCVGARLNLDETKDLLARAGYALSPCDKRDIIFSFFIEHAVFDMIEIDIALEEHGLPCFIE